MCQIFERSMKRSLLHIKKARLMYDLLLFFLTRSLFYKPCSHNKSPFVFTLFCRKRMRIKICLCQELGCAYTFLFEPLYLFSSPVIIWWCFRTIKLGNIYNCWMKCQFLFHIIWNSQKQRSLYRKSFKFHPIIIQLKFSLKK